jgi:hypothetical protein
MTKTVVKWVNNCEGRLLKIDNFVVNVSGAFVDLDLTVENLLGIVEESEPENLEVYKEMFDDTANDDFIVQIKFDSPKVVEDLGTLDDCIYAEKEGTLACYYFVGETAILLQELFA